MVLTEKQIIKVRETLKDFLCLIPRYIEVKEDKDLYDLFLSRNRNPLFDLTNTKFWETGLSSENALKSNSKIVKDHYIPRKIAMGYIMDELVSNPNITLNQFISLCKKYSSTVNLTKEEHDMVTLMAKNTGKCNYEFYSSCNIIIEGIDKVIPVLK